MITERINLKMTDVIALLPTMSLAKPNGAQLSTNPAHNLCFTNDEKMDSIQSIRIFLRDGTVSVNGKNVSIPIGMSRTMTAKEFKKFAAIYSGDALYISRENGMQRVRDTEVVEIVPDTVFTHKKVVSVPRYSRD
ncbi:hypothetical protein MUP38_04635 [Candidatus Bathyarchaeota archaeon]|nr:hypothetical protein [Candidatus Bathyarchaeota archaeon]